MVPGWKIVQDSAPTMAKSLLLVLFLAGCISNMCNSLLIPHTFDPENDRNLKLVQEYDADSVTELYDEGKKRAKRADIANVTPSELPVSEGSVPTASSVNTESSGSEAKRADIADVTPSGLPVSGGSVPTVSSVNTESSGSEGSTVTLSGLPVSGGSVPTVPSVNTESSGSEGSTESALAPGELLPSNSTMVQVDEPLFESEFISAIFEIFVDLLSDIETREKRDLFFKNPLDAIFNLFGKLDGESRPKNDADEFVLENEQESDEDEVAFDRAAALEEPATPRKPLESNSRTSIQVFDSNIIKIIDNVSNIMDKLSNFNNLLYGNNQSTRRNPKLTDSSETTRGKRGILFNALDSVLGNVGKKIVEEGNPLLTQLKTILPLPDILPKIPDIAKLVEEGNPLSTQLKTIVPLPDILPKIPGIATAARVNDDDLSEEKESSKMRGGIISSIRHTISDFVQNLITVIYAVYGTVKTALQAILLPSSRRKRTVNAFGELFTGLRRPFNGSPNVTGIEEYFRRLEDRISDSFKAFEDSFP